MVFLEELDENNNIIVKTDQNNKNQDQSSLKQQIPPELNQTFFQHQQVPIFLPNMMPQFPGMPFSFNIQMGPNNESQRSPHNMFIFKNNNLN